MHAGDGMHAMHCRCAVLLEGARVQGCSRALLSQCLWGSRLVAAQDREDVCVRVRVDGGGCALDADAHLELQRGALGGDGLSEWTFDRFCLRQSENSSGVLELSGAGKSLGLLHELSHKEESR
jgi:hypothetical protein